MAGGDSEEIAIRLVSAWYFATLGVPMIRGSSFDPAREPAPGAAPYAVISDQYWQRRLGGRSDVIVQTIALRGGIVSLLVLRPPPFSAEPSASSRMSGTPLAMQSAVLAGTRLAARAPRGVSKKLMWLHVFGRLAERARPREVRGLM